MSDNEFESVNVTDNASLGPTPDEETALTTTIGQLWATHVDRKATAKRTKEELATIRLGLGEQLQKMKLLLVGTGRSGQWSAFLRQQQIPRCTGDRLVQSYERSLTPIAKNCLTEAINPCAAAEAFAASVLRRARKVLTTPAAFHVFVAALAAGIDDGFVQRLENGLLVRNS